MNLESILKGAHLSKSSRKWLVMALDPFHDTEVEPMGYPDVHAGQSITRLVRTETTVSAPAAVTWDCCVCSLPILASGNNQGSALSRTSAIDVAYESSPPTGFYIGAVMINSALTGQELFPNEAIATWAPTNFVNQVVPNCDVVPGIARVVASGFEVINTTQSLYKAGTVSCGMFTQPNDYFRGVVTDADPTIGPIIEGFSHVHSAPPCSTIVMANMPSVRAWEAKDGAYCTSYMASEENSPRQSGPANHLFFNNPVFTNNAFGFMTVPIIVKLVPNWPTITTPYNSNFAFFSGLTPETTLRVVVRTYIETFPTFHDDLLPLAHRSPAYDKYAMQLYGAIVGHLPPGVPVTHNAMGDWFRKVASIVRYVAPVIGIGLQAVGVPGAAAAGGLISAGAGAFASRRRRPPNSRRQPKKKKKNQIQRRR